MSCQFNRDDSEPERSEHTCTLDHPCSSTDRLSVWEVDEVNQVRSSVSPHFCSTCRGITCPFAVLQCYLYANSPLPGSGIAHSDAVSLQPLITVLLTPSLVTLTTLSTQWGFSVVSICRNETE